MDWTWVIDKIPLVFGAVASIAAGIVVGILYARVGTVQENDGGNHGGSTKVPPREQKKMAPARRYDYEHFREQRRVDELTEENKLLTNLLVVTLPGLTKKINETQNEREVAPLLGDAVNRLLVPPPDVTLVFRCAQDAERELVLAHKAGDDAEEIPDHLHISMDEGHVGRALSKRMALDRKDYEREERRKSIAEGKAESFFHTEICAPIMHGEEILGALVVDGFETYHPNAKKMLIVAANLGAMAITNARMFQQIQEMADCDNLTKLYNKRFFFKRLDAELENARVTGKPLSLFMFDIDNFKNYNDTNGHQAGDECLRLTGQILRKRKRETDTAARYGGEEFILILPDTDKDGAYAFGEKMRKAIQEHDYPHEENQPMGDLTISGGIATYPEDGFSGEHLVQHADSCLYEAKESGRNRVCR